MPTPISNAWNAILDVLQKIIVPDWSDPIHWLPLLLSGLVVLALLMLALRWRSLAAMNRPRVARRLAAGAPPPGVHLPGPSPWPFFLPIGLAIVLFALVLHDKGQYVNAPLLLVGLVVTAAVLGGWIRDAMMDWRRVDAAASGHDAALLPAHAIGGARPDVHALASGTWVLPRAALGPGSTGGEPGAGAGDIAHQAPAGVHLPGPSPWPFFLPIGAMFVLYGLVFSPALLLGGLLMTVIALAGWFRDASNEYRQVDAGHAPEPRTRDPERAFPKALVGVFALIAVASIAVAAAPSMIAMVNASPAPAQGGIAAGAGGPASGQLHVVAQNVAFDTSSLTAPSGKQFTIVFENRDSVPHNIAIYDSSKLTTKFFRGEIFAGPGSKTYTVPALKPGTYYFHCDVHPTMNGTLVVK